MNALHDGDFPPLKNDLILRVARGESVERVPVWIMRQAGRYLPEFREARKRNDFFTICRNPELACEVTLQPITRYSGLLDASIIFSDILVVPQALGMEVQMLEKQGPHFPNPLRTPEDIDKLIFPVDTATSLRYVYDAITLTRKQLGGQVPLFGFAGAPWTLMAYMIEGGGSKTLSKAKGFLFQHPKESHRLLKMVTDVVVDFLINQVKAGAQLLQVFDSWAGELSPQDFNEFSLPYLNDIAERLKTEFQKLGYNVPIVVFARGAHYAVESLSKSKYDVISLDWTMDPKMARSKSNGKTLQGNADPSVLYAAPEKIRSVVKEMLEGFGPGSKYIGNLGHGMYPDHDPERLRAYLEAIMNADDVDFALKVLVVGNGCVGKSSLIRRLCKGRFNENYKKTIGVDYSEVEIDVPGHVGPVRLMLWDTAGQEEFDPVTRSYYENAHAVVFAFSTTDRDSFETIKAWREKVEAVCDDICMVLVQNKIDLLEHTVVSDEEAESLARDMKLKFYRVSVKEYLNVLEVFTYLAELFFKRQKKKAVGPPSDIRQIREKLGQLPTTISNNFTAENQDPLEEKISDPQQAVQNSKSSTTEKLPKKADNCIIS
ncbi:hypothetical protein HDU67_006104 [Dinochytrium kinnereticum]|nr:hypothetical protein HDU67_006104 [Dinochytrium kinnereticum]